MTSALRARCLLFFPGSRPELLPKAAGAGPDRVCVDLEDAVEADAKGDARAAVAAMLTDSVSPPDAVRVNHPATPDGRLDLEVLGASPPAMVMVPKVESTDDLDVVARAFTAAAAPPSFVATIETARGLADVERIAAHSRVSLLFFGALDLSVDLGCALAWEPLLYARARCVVAARLAGVGMLDAPFFDVRDHAGLGAEAERARAMGFTGKAAIHPTQVAAILSAFGPTAEELVRARRVVEQADTKSDGAFLVDGVMIDRPAIEAARRLVQEAEELGS